MGRGKRIFLKWEGLAGKLEDDLELRMSSIVGREDRRTGDGI